MSTERSGTYDAAASGTCSRIGVNVGLLGAVDGSNVGVRCGGGIRWGRGSKETDTSWSSSEISGYLSPRDVGNDWAGTGPYGSDDDGGAVSLIHVL